MRVLVNALSATNLSGRHVLLGHLSRLAEWTVDRHDYTVLYHNGNGDICRDLGANVKWIECPGYTAQWAARALWERVALPRMASRLGIDVVFTPSGIAVPHLSTPQIVFAQNPWCLVSGIHRKPLEEIKAAAQRRAYKEAMRVASLMVFNSEYMRWAYRQNAGFQERASGVVYQALDEDAHAAAASLRGTVKRRAMQVLSVSAMAPHKGVETVVKALAAARRLHRVSIQLVLVGAWPHRKYEHKVRSLVAELELTSEVEFRGHVPRDELWRLYAESKVFCLMSHCESFGIPAVEAQAFGTPVVSSNCCAIPEVCGEGGTYPEPGDSRGAADAIAKLLTDEPAWRQLSEAAVQNAAKYRWELCTRPLMQMFDVVRT